MVWGSIRKGRDYDRRHWIHEVSPFFHPVSLTASLFRDGEFEFIMHCDFRFNDLRATPIDFNGPIYSQSLKRTEGGAEAGVLS